MRPSSPNQPQPVARSGGAAPYAPPQYGRGGQPAVPVMSTTESIAQNHPFLSGQVTPGQHTINNDMIPNVQKTDSVPQQTAVVSSGAGQQVNPGGQAAIPPPTTNPNSTQNMLQFAEIRDGIIIMNDGTFRSIVMVKSINFDLMSQSEQEAVEFSYQGFLNSLYFPVQIFIRSQKIDLAPYLERLGKIKSEHDNMLLATLMDDYIEFMAELSQQTNIMDKRFYIIIPYEPKPDVQKALTNSRNFITGIVELFSTKEKHVVINEADLEQAKTELRNRVQSVLGGLLQCGIQSIPLDTQELIELLYDTYNPDTATRQQIKDFDDLSADVVSKGAGMASQAHLRGELQ